MSEVIEFIDDVLNEPIAEESIGEVIERVGLNILLSYYDSFIQQNAELRANVGFKTYITRETHGKACDWCNALSGTYRYGDEPSDIYRRHDNCRCKVTYYSTKDKIAQDVWTKVKTSQDVKPYQEAYLQLLDSQKIGRLSAYKKFAERLEARQ